MRKQANSNAGDEEDDVDDDDDDENDIGNDGDNVNNTMENLKIFSCSSTEYLKLRGKLSKDGPAQVENNIVYYFKYICL